MLISFYGDDFTGSTDALEQLALAGLQAALFIEPPTRRQLARFGKLDAVGIAGKTRALGPGALEREIRPALKALKALGARHVHYKVCSTFDSSPKVGSIGRVIDIAAEIFRAPFVPVLAAAPGLGRYSVFGNLFARYGIGSNGAIHRLDRHPSVSRHPVTPMTEADLGMHLARQTRKRIALFDILKIGLPLEAAKAALETLLRSGAEVVFFDALCPEHLVRIGELLDGYAAQGRPLFSVGSSGIETALGMAVRLRSGRRRPALTPGKEWRGLTSAATGVEGPVLIGSGSCSPVTTEQISWALRHGFREVSLDLAALASDKESAAEIHRAAGAAARFLRAGRSAMIHTTGAGFDPRVAARLKTRTAQVLGSVLGQVLRAALMEVPIRRVCVAGGDTSSFAARALGVEALEMICPLTPGAPLCRAHAPGSPADGLEVVFKGGQVGAVEFFRLLHEQKGEE
jgi:uncharacterized protein YgbK (DUF1537 family)